MPNENISNQTLCTVTYYIQNIRRKENESEKEDNNR